MEKLITKTEKQAISLAKSMLRHSSEVGRLPLFLVRHSSTECYCGQTSAIIVDAKIKGNWISQSMGYCKHCYNG